MHVILEAIAGPHITKRIAIPSYLKGTVGRTEWADHQFPEDRLMSSQHFSIECVGSTCLLRDLGSTNGTYVNEERVVECAVVTGSIIRAGQTTIKVTLVEGQTLRRPSIARAADSSRSPIVVTEMDSRSERAEPPVQRPVPRLDLAGASTTHEEALKDADPIVRRNTLWAAAWGGRRWVLDYCRALCSPPKPENWETLMLLGVLGEVADVGRILSISRTAELGPERFRILGAFGHPEIVNDLLVGIENTNPEIAVMAGKAFTKITRVDLRAVANAASTSSAQPPPTESQPALDDSAMPNVETARRAWRKLKDKFTSGRRWLGGFEVSRGLPAELINTIDLESRFEACLRGRYQGTWQASRFDREQLADKLASR